MNGPMRYNSTYRTFALVAATLGVPVLALAQPTQQELLDRVSKLESEVQVLRANQASTPKPADPAAVAGAQSAVKADASKHSAVPGSAGYDGGFYIKSADGSFSLKPSVQFQFRSVYNAADNINSAGEDNSEQNFEIRRLKLGFAGNVFTSKLTYDFVIVANRNGSAVTLETAMGQYEFTDGWFFKFGQFKEPTFHEEITSSKRQLAVDRSLANELLGGGRTDYVEGVALIYGGAKKNDNPLNVELGLTDGINSDGTRAVAPPNSAADFGGYVRVDYKISGNWKNYADFTALGTKEDLVVVGGGVSYTQTGDLDAYLATVDAQWEMGNGFSLYVAGLLNYSDAAAGSETDYGVVAQGAYLLPSMKNVEVFGRYSGVFLDETIAVGNTTEDVFHEFTVGGNYYFGEDGKYGHRAKFTLDVGYLPNGSPAENGIGVQGSGDDQFYVRAQFQLLI